MEALNNCWNPRRIKAELRLCFLQKRIVMENLSYVYLHKWGVLWGAAFVQQENVAL